MNPLKLKDCEHESGPSVLFAKIWLKIKVLFYFKSFSFVSSCIDEIYILFSFETFISFSIQFRFPFRFLFRVLVTPNKW